MLPPLYLGVSCLSLRGIGIRDGSIEISLTCLRELLLSTLLGLAKQGFRVIVLLTGHYPREQVFAVKEVAKLCERIMETASAKGIPQVRVLAFPEYELALDLGYRGDHAAKQETSIMMYLRPELVNLSRLTDLLGIHGEDPRKFASPELGKQVVERIVERLVELVQKALRELGSH